MADEIDLRLFEIIYSRNVGKDMDAILNDVFLAKLALASQEQKIKYASKDAQKAAETEAAQASEPVQIDEKPKKPTYTKDDLLIKSPKKIHESISEESITCCLCGKAFKTLGAHLRSHGLKTKEYLELVGLPPDTSLMGRKFYEVSKERAKNAFQHLPRNRKKAAAAAAAENEEIPEDEIQIDPPIDSVKPGENTPPPPSGMPKTPEEFEAQKSVQEDDNPDGTLSEELQGVNTAKAS